MGHKLNLFRWKEQAAAALAKGQDWIGQFGRLAQPTKGASRANMRRLYLAIAVPRMLYAAEIFLTPQTHNMEDSSARKSGRAVINKLASIQRRAALSITGAMRSTPTDTLDALADLLPLHLLIEKHRHQAALRLATLPKNHPLQQPVINARKRFVKKQPTPLHYMMYQFKLKPEKIEKIEAVRHTPKWTPNLTTQIARTKEEAASEDRADRTEVQVYTDGSGLDGRIGAAAVLFRQGKEISQIRYCLGKATHHTVFEGECAGLLLGMELIRREQNIREATICIDNQATITAAAANTTGPGRHIIDEFHKQQKRTEKKHTNLALVLRWTPGHFKIEGNEVADKAARKASEGNVSNNNKIPSYLRKPLPYSKSALRQTYHQKLKARATSVWKKSPRYQRTNYLIPNLPNREYRTSMARLPRRYTSIISQIITGHIPLAKHLHRIRKAESPTCPSCREHNETITHYILHCPVHRRARRELMEAIPDAEERNLPGMLANHKNRIHLLNFVAKTQRLKSVFGDIAEIPEDE